MATGPALALLELDSIARGIVTLDRMVKRAEVTVVEAKSVSPGRYLIHLTGGVGELEEALAVGLTTAGDALLDFVWLPNPHPSLAALLAGEEVVIEPDSMGIVECYTSASAVKAVDAAAKTADVVVTRLNLANQLGGKGWFLMTGELHMVEAALEAAAAAVTEGMLLTVELIAAPHDDTGSAF